MKTCKSRLDLLRTYAGKYQAYVCCLYVFLFPLDLALAQVTATTAQELMPGKEAVEEDPLDRLTPRGCVVGFLQAARRENYSLAAQYLDTRLPPDRAQELARQLRRTLDFATTVNLDRLSRSREGDLEDGLRITTDRVGVLELDSRELEILVDRVQRGEQPRIWLFSSETLRDVPEAVQEISSLDFRLHLPRPMVAIRFLSLPLYRWIGIFLGLALALGGASLVTRGLLLVLRPLIRRIPGKEEYRRLLALVAPVRLLLLAIAIALLSRFGFSVLSRQFWARVAVVLAVVGLVWLVMRLSDVASEWATRHLQQVQRSGGLALVGFTRRVFKAAALVTSALFFLYYIVGFDLTAILAGLGLGGVAIAFAAQKTIENLFGGVSLIAAEPIRVGDFCRAADLMGTVEDVGMRATRIRTLDRTVVSIPNSQLAEAKLENFSMRDRFWFHPKIGVRYETTADQLRNVLTEITAMLTSHPKVDPESARVRFTAFGDSSLDIDIFAYVYETEMTPFLTLQEELLLRIMDIIQACGTQIAYPSQTVYFTEDNWPDSAGSRRIPTNLQKGPVRNEPRVVEGPGQYPSRG